MNIFLEEGNSHECWGKTIIKITFFQYIHDEFAEILNVANSVLRFLKIVIIWIIHSNKCTLSTVINCNGFMNEVACK